MTLYKKASILKNSRVLFGIHGNKYRLIVKIQYEFSHVYIRFIGIYKQHDSIIIKTKSAYDEAPEEIEQLSRQIVSTTVLIITP